MRPVRKYLIKIDEDLYYETDTLSEARRVAESLNKRFQIENLSHNIVIEKHTTKIEIVNNYKTEELTVNNIF